MHNFTEIQELGVEFMRNDSILFNLTLLGLTLKNACQIVFITKYMHT